jgi:hypothetical protein
MHPIKAPAARWMAAIDAAAVMSISIVMRVHAGDLGSFIRQRQERIAFGAAEATAGLFPQEEDHKSEYKRQADREGERDNGHMRG